MNDTAPPTAHARPSWRRRSIWIGGLVALVAAGTLYWGLGGERRGAESYLTLPVERGMIRNSVAATGTIQAVLTVQVGSQVTGRIASLHADFNSVVKAGQILARIDPANFDAQLERARADLTDARAGVGTAEASVATQRANLQAARVAAEDARRALGRSRELGEDGIVSSRDLEVAQAAHDEALARVDQGQAQVRASEAALDQARARVEQSKAAVRIAEINRYYTEIVSPVDGVVISRSVDVGQTVSASLQAPTIFTIANDLTKMQVVANVDEADIGSIAPEAKVTFTVDAFPGEVFAGALNQIRLDPQAQQNVVTYSVIIDVPNPDLKLRPGMTANTVFTIAERRDALRIANAALRFWPDSVPRAQEAEILSRALGEDRGAGKGAPRAESGNQETAGDGVPAGRPPSGGAPGAGGPASRRGAPPEGAPAAGGGRRAAGAGSPPAKDDGTYLAAVAEAGEVIRFPAGRKPSVRPRVVWVLGEGGAPEPRVVRMGITDGTATEIVGGEVNEGDAVVVGRQEQGEAVQGRSPFGPSFGPPRRSGSSRPSGGR